MKPAFRLWLPGICWLAFSFVLFTIPGSEIKIDSWMERYQLDKLVHAFLFFVLVYLFYFPFLRAVPPNTEPPTAPKYWFVLVPLAAIGYGISIEYLQRCCIPNRGFEISDMWADLAGSLTAWLFFGRQRMVSTPQKPVIDSKTSD